MLFRLHNIITTPIIIINICRIMLGQLTRSRLEIEKDVVP